MSVAMVEKLVWHGRKISRDDRKISRSMVKKVVAPWSKTDSRHGRKISRSMVKKSVASVEKLLTACQKKSRGFFEKFVAVVKKLVAKIIEQSSNK